MGNAVLLFVFELVSQVQDVRTISWLERSSSFSRSFIAFHPFCKNGWVLLHVGHQDLIWKMRQALVHLALG